MEGVLPNLLNSFWQKLLKILPNIKFFLLFPQGNFVSWKFWFFHASFCTHAVNVKCSQLNYTLVKYVKNSWKYTFRVWLLMFMLNSRTCISLEHKKLTASSANCKDLKKLIMRQIFYGQQIFINQNKDIRKRLSYCHFH